MPRFDNEGFNPNKRINNDSRDRSVPEDENYYGHADDFASLFRDAGDGEVTDNQGGQYGGDLEPPRRYGDNGSGELTPEMLHDFGGARRPERRDVNREAHTRDKRPRRRRKTPPVKKALRILVVAVLVICLSGVLTVNAVLSRIHYDEPKDNAYVAAHDLESSMLVKNILLLGVDARPNQESETSRADSMMLISIDMKHKCIKMTSFLRDTWVYIPAHEGEQRLNAASTYDGYSGVADTIEYNFGVKVDGYVVANFEMFKVLVDSVGGVEVDVTEKEAKEVTNHPKRYGKVKLKSGKHKLNGKQALAYCRIRKIDTDFVRTKRQRTVMQSILKEVKKGNPFKLLKMALNCAPYIETDLTKGQLQRIAMAGMTCLKGEMVQTRVPFEHTWEYANKSGASVIAINTEKNKEMLIDYIYRKTAEEIKAEEQ